MKLSKQERINLLRNSIDVSGNRLLNNNTTDEQISKQIDILDKMIFKEENDIQVYNTTIYRDSNQIENQEESFNFIEKSISEFYNYDKGFDRSFWYGFGSAPYYQKFEDEKGDKGGVGMDTIFGDQFENCHTLMCDVEYKISQLQNDYVENKLKNKEIKINIVSKYSDIDDLENNVVVKNIHKESETFYKDSTKDFDKRIKVFNKYGNIKPYIFEPKHPILKRIFQIIQEQDYYEKYQKIECEFIIEMWIEILCDNRTHIDYNQNKYHPSINKIKRNYTPIDEAIKRLSDYYMKLIMEEGVASFTYDW